MVQGKNFFSRNFGPRTNFSRTKIPVTDVLLAPVPLDGHAEPQLGRKFNASGVIKEYNIQLISRMQLQEVQNGVQYDKGVLTLGH